jgi:phosphoserine aminotransferase
MIDSGLNFYPGPSKLYPQVREFMAEAYDSGVLSCNHRSQKGMELIAAAILATKKHLNIPAGYHVYFTSSATECWEIVAQSLLRGKVQFLYNGAFGKKWFKYAVTNPSSAANLKPRGSRFSLEQTVSEIEIDVDNLAICAVTNETSNGSQISENEILKLRKNNPNALICLDATSGLGGRDFNISNADVWFASVQKCFGLPAGMGVMIVSPRTIEMAEKINERNHYNSLLVIHENFLKSQTHYTPNMLGIFLLKRLLESLPNISEIATKNKARAEKLFSELNHISQLKPLISNPETRSETVLAFEIDNPGELLKSLSNQNITLGKGYGEWIENSIRIANFPAISDSDFETLIKTLKQHYHAI